MKKQELEAMSDLNFAAAMLQERLDRIYNPYTPLAKKLRSAIDCLKELDASEHNRPKNKWIVTFTDENGALLDIHSIPFRELERIGMMVKVGFATGNVFAESDGGETDADSSL